MMESMLKKTLILVISTGRSRSHSFAHWLMSLRYTYVLHEGGSPSRLGFLWYRIAKFFNQRYFDSDHVFLWTGDLQYKIDHLQRLLENTTEQFVGDTGMFYFGKDSKEDVLRTIIKLFKDRCNIKIIFLERDKDEVVGSFLQRSLDIRPDGGYKTKWWFPWLTGFVEMCKLNFPEGKKHGQTPREVLEDYHDEFIERTQLFIEEFPDFCMNIPVEELDKKSVRRDVLMFLGYPNVYASKKPLPKLNTKSLPLNMLSRSIVLDKNEWPALK